MAGPGDISADGVPESREDRVVTAKPESRSARVVGINYHTLRADLKFQPNR